MMLLVWQVLQSVMLGDVNDISMELVIWDDYEWPWLVVALKVCL